MEGIREYLLSVTAGAILCGVLCALTDQKESQAKLFRLICGLFLCLLVVSPLARIQFTDVTDLTADLLSRGQAASQDGTEQYEEDLRSIITDETRAYIMDKARSYGAEIQVEITLSEDALPVPEACVIKGSLSPYVRQQLKKILIQDLGIREENHTWLQ